MIVREPEAAVGRPGCGRLKTRGAGLHAVQDIERLHLDLGSGPRGPAIELFGRDPHQPAQGGEPESPPIIPDQRVDAVAGKPLALVEGPGHSVPPSREPVGTHAPDRAVGFDEEVGDPAAIRAWNWHKGVEPALAEAGYVAIAKSEPESVFRIGVASYGCRIRHRQKLPFLEFADTDETGARPHHDGPHVVTPVLREVNDRTERLP